jgi:hypothetical protein
MKDELRDRLLAAAPKLYTSEPSPEDKENLSPRQLARYYGPVYFGVGDGWFDILLDLSVKLEAMDGITSTHVVQVKEKFGGLRFYVSSATEEMYRAINEAESASYEICEACGEPGTIRNTGWVQTLCDEHAEERS